MTAPEARQRLSEAQRDLMRHTLGLDRSKKPFRNHYCANPEDDETCAAWDDLVSRGLATKAQPRPWLPYYTYRVTPAGRAALDTRKCATCGGTGSVLVVECVDGVIPYQAGAPCPDCAALDTERSE